MAELLFFRDGNLQMRTALRQDRVTIGRAAPSDIIVPDFKISRLQCEIIRRPTGYTLIDKSGRDTPVGKRYASETGTTLKDGDEIRLGGYSVVFSVADAPSPSDPTAPVRTKRTRIGPAKAHRGEVLRSRLRVQQPEGEATLVLREVDGFSAVVGSDPDGPAQLTLKDAFASARHARIAWTGGRWVLTDLSSSNGTFVDGVSVLSCVLNGQRAIRVGETTLWFDQEFDDALSDQLLPGLVSHDPAMIPVVDAVRRIAPSNVPVLVHGETGSGKEIIAHALHLLSPRREGPFVAINCGAIPRETAESELFGHEKGAFTGAESARIGAFSEADGGTLFLDEIGELPPAIQVKLLRVLETGELRRLGGSRTHKVSVRLVSATHRDLPAAIAEQTFREDLYYRLCVAPIEIPPLRQRRADVFPLAEHFAAEFAGGSVVTFTPEAREKLEAYPWPGNARELRNAVQRAMLVRDGATVTAKNVEVRGVSIPPPPSDMVPVTGRTIAEIERDIYRLALHRFPGDTEGIMKELGISRSTYFRRLADYGWDGQHPPPK